MNAIRNFASSVWDVAKVVIISAAIIIPIRTFIFQPFFVRGTSMVPTFYNGDYLLIDELTYRFREPSRGEVIVFRYPNDPKQFYIKRIIGLPGEKVSVRNGSVSVLSEGNEIQLEEPYISPGSASESRDIVAGPDEYIVFGDNRPHSSDSRSWGPVPEKYFIGRVFLTAWPLNDIAVFAAPTY